MSIEALNRPTLGLERFLLVRFETQERNVGGYSFSSYSQPESLWVLDHGGGKRTPQWRVPGGASKSGESPYRREFEEETNLPFPERVRLFENQFERTRFGVGLVPAERYRRNPGLLKPRDKEIVMARWFRLSQLAIFGRERGSEGARCHKGDLLLLRETLVPHIGELSSMFGRALVRNFLAKLV